MAPTEAAATPLPREETTPPVMKMYLVAMARAGLLDVGQASFPRPRAVAAEGTEGFGGAARPTLHRRQELAGQPTAPPYGRRAGAGRGRGPALSCRARVRRR